MKKPLHIDPLLFEDASISDETSYHNKITAERLKDFDQWAEPPQMIREIRARGEGPMPLAPQSERAFWHEIEGPAGHLRLRIIAPENPTGAYLHFHYGGWVFGGADQQDPWLARLVQNCGLACASVEYRLAPENPYPAAPDDCEAAALWFIKNADSLFKTDRFFIGGESVGAHLSVITLKRLRDSYDLTPFTGAVLTAGIYDLTMTPSARNWGNEKLILTTQDIENFIESFVPGSNDRRSPDLSPLYANLNRLPPALFTVGTKDPLLDDSLFMAQRWLAAGKECQLAIYPGGAHVHIAFPTKLAQQALDRIDAFINDH